MREREFALILPPPASAAAPGGEAPVQTSSGSVVIVGANGSGKSRLGAWIELASPQGERVHRVSAQKSLTIPETVSTTNVDAALATLHYGSAQGGYLNRIGHRWQGKPATYLQSDFDKLLAYLFTEDYDISTRFRQAARGGDAKDVPEVKLDVVKRIWEAVLPHRELIIGGGKVEARLRSAAGSLPYAGSEMSDGERVIFYLVGQCLAAKSGSIIVIDEPELHLHRSLQSSLWDAIEAEREDCLFVYITHDVDFAMTRVGAPKVCVKSFDGTNWDWYVAPTDLPGIPEEMLLQIVGSRRPVLFVEGEKGSLDQFILTKLYPSHSIVPLSSCSNVIHATASFRSLRHFHSLECVGIIDRDYRPADELGRLETMGVFALGVAEIENLLLVEGVLRCAADGLLRPDAADLVARVRDRVFEEFERDKERIVSAAAAARIEAALGRFDAKALGEAGLSDSVTKRVGSIDVAAIYAESRGEVECILSARDYSAAIGLYSNKGLIAHASAAFDFKGQGLAAYMKRLLNSKDGQAALDAMRAYTPTLPNTPAVQVA